MADIEGLSKEMKKIITTSSQLVSTRVTFPCTFNPLSQYVQKGTRGYYTRFVRFQ